MKNTTDFTPWNLTYGMRNITENSDQKGKELFISYYITRSERLQLFD